MIDVTLLQTPDLEPALVQLIITATAGAQDELAALRRAASRDGVLVATEQGIPLAVLRGAISESGYRIFDIYMTEAAALHAQIVPAFGEFLLRQFPGQRIEARITPSSRQKTLHELLEKAGAELILDQQIYQRDLTGMQQVENDSFQYLRYSEFGKTRLLQLLTRIFAGRAAGRLTTDPLRELDQMIFDATTDDGKFDDTLWWVALLEGQPVGVILGHVYGAAQRQGCLLYFGLVPELRGAGWGKRLHRAALGRLAAAGVQLYEDATTHDNLAMRRIFAANGCIPVGLARAYVLHWEPDTGQLQDVNALVQHLRDEQYQLEILSEQPVWIRVPIRFGRHAVTLDLGWSQDTRLLQIQHHYPWSVPAEAASRIALVVAALNASLSVPGFVFSVGTQKLGFRLPVFLDQHGGISVPVLRRALAVVVHTVATYQPWWHAALSGTDSGDQTSLSEIFSHLL